MKLPETWLTVRLGDICLLNPPLAEEERPAPTTPVSFVPMSAVDENRAEIVAAEVRPYAEVMRGYTPFRTGDVLFAKITPSMENGKAAVASALEGGIGFGSTEFHVMRPSEHLLPEYLLYFIRQEAFRQRAADAFIGSAGQQRVPQDFLARTKLPLPTLAEQQRIVELLQQADVIRRNRAIAEKLVDQLVQSTYGKLFGKYFSSDGINNEVRIGTYIADAQYGVSEAMDEAGTHAILRMNNLTTGGWLDLTDLKYASLSGRDAAATELQPGDLLFNRTNSRELVGKCAIWRETKGTFSFASYLVRLRFKPEMLPEYVWATLNSPYGKFRLFNAAKQAVSMSNISPTDLARMPIPKPPLDEQEKFAALVREIESIRALFLKPHADFVELQHLLQQSGIFGELTERWREAHVAELANADKERRAVLGKAAKRVTVTITEHAPEHRDIKLARPARNWLIEQLSEFQNNVRWALYTEWKGTIIPDDTEAFDNFCRLWPIEHEENVKERTRRALEQLAAVGLVAKVTLRNEKGKFVTGYRVLREEEYTRLSDAEEINSKLKKPNGDQGTGQS